MALPALITPPHGETATTVSPDGRQVVAESWHLFHQGLADRVALLLARTATLDALNLTASYANDAAAAAGGVAVGGYYRSGSAVMIRIV